MTKRKKETRGPLFSFPVDISGRGLRCWHNLNVVQANMGGPGDCENNGVGAETDEISGAQHGFLPGTAAAVDEADDVERLVGRNVGENAAAFADGFEIQHAWAIISGLIATDDADFHK